MFDDDEESNDSGHNDDGLVSAIIDLAVDFVFQDDPSGSSSGNELLKNWKTSTVFTTGGIIGVVGGAVCYAMGPSSGLTFSQDMIKLLPGVTSLSAGVSGVLFNFYSKLEPFQLKARNICLGVGLIGTLATPSLMRGIQKHFEQENKKKPENYIETKFTQENGGDITSKPDIAYYRGPVSTSEPTIH